MGSGRTGIAETVVVLETVVVMREEVSSANSYWAVREATLFSFRAINVRYDD